MRTLPKILIQCAENIFQNDTRKNNFKKGGAKNNRKNGTTKNNRKNKYAKNKLLTGRKGHKTKKAMKEIDPKKLYSLLYRDFTNKKDDTYNISCVKHESGYLYASDAHILAKVKYDYPENMEGKAIDANGNEMIPMVNYESAIPEKSESDRYLSDEEIDNLRVAAKKVYRIGKGNFKAVIDLGLPHADKWDGEFIVTFKAAYLNSAFKLFDILKDKPKIRIYDSYTHLIIFESTKNDTIVLCMSILSEVDKDKRVYPTFTVQEVIEYIKPNKETVA